MDSVPNLYRRALWGSMDRLGVDELAEQADTLLGLLETFGLSAQPGADPMAAPSTPGAEGVASDSPDYYP